MGNVYNIARATDFWVNNLNDFKEGLEGFIGGELGSEVQFQYSDYKKRSKKALINMSSEDFSMMLWHRDDEDIYLNLLKYIQKHITDEEEVVIYSTEYEHATDMSITKYIINKECIEEIEILE